MSMGWLRRGTRSPSSVLVGAILLAGAVLRIVHWQLFFPIWKHFSVFTMVEIPVLEYLGNFQSYSAVRMPFYDAFAGAFYVLTRGFLGVRALTVFSLVVVLVSLPVFYVAVRGLFDRRIAVFALVFYALYPKFVVLTAMGFPEAPSVAFVVFTLAALLRARDTTGDGLAWYAAAGVFATVAFLLFVPAVAFAVLVAGLVYLHDRPNGASLRASVPGRASVAYNVVPFVAGSSYLAFGPLGEAASTTTGGWTNMSTSLFAPGSDYTLLEKAVRYVAYMYADVWSFGRGYDKGYHVVAKFESLAAFSGDLYPLLLAGFVGVTLGLSLCILLGLRTFASDRSRLAWFVLAWVGVYVFLHTLKNAGWTGTFQSRHVFPVFPAIAIAFGVGATQLHALLAPASRPASVEAVGDSLGRVGDSLGRVGDSLGHTSDVLPAGVASRETLVALLLVASFVPVLGVSTVDAHFAGQSHDLANKQPVAELEGIVEDEDRVGVVEITDYQTIVLFSENAIRPTILVANDSRAAEVRTWTEIAEYHIVTPGDIEDAPVDYLYFSRCGSLEDDQSAYLDAAKAAGTVVFEQEKSRGSGRCTVRTIVVRLDATASDGQSTTDQSATARPANIHHGTDERHVHRPTVTRPTTASRVDAVREVVVTAERSSAVKASGSVTRVGEGGDR
jgi:hypothetical protein